MGRKVVVCPCFIALPFMKQGVASQAKAASLTVAYGVYVITQ